jgi:hypothetical protein
VRRLAWVRREKKSPGTTSEERLRAEAPVRCRSCTSEPAIPDVVTRDGPELYNRGNRSSMTAFGAVLVVKITVARRSLACVIGLDFVALSFCGGRAVRGRILGSYRSSAKPQIQRSNSPIINIVVSFVREDLPHPNEKKGARCESVEESTMGNAL